ncbi:uncharacterized protein JCM6883_006950 [Sporobolomyces salmoneus]|uniref:uncharacterized protein n=1 Tax=Sporobolomyces salmoneus TaxID=183962 RepID=UPI00317DC4D4
MALALPLASTSHASPPLPQLIQPPPLSRPSLPPRTTSYASNPSTSSTTTSSTRLLWRGSISTGNNGRKLHGIAIIAHLFSVPSHSHSQSPSLNSPSFSPFEDPFSSASKASTSGADMCLGLEMLRGKDLVLLDSDSEVEEGSSFSVEHVQSSSTTPFSSPEVERKQSATSRKGKSKEVGKETVKVETPTDVRVYIDQRCRETVEWFQDKFCRVGCEGNGVRLDAGGEQIIIFAQLPSTPSTSLAQHSPATSSSTAGPSTSTTTAAELPPLTLLLGRPFKPVVRKPRPDDPLPRESLFTAKLRKTASLPATAFSKTSLSSSSITTTPKPSSTIKKKPRLNSKEKSILSLMGPSKTVVAEEETTTSMRRPNVPQRRQGSIPPGGLTLPVPNPTAGTKRGLSRSVSTNPSSSSNRSFSTSTSSSTTTNRQGSLPPQPTSLSSTTSTTGRAFKRSRSSLPSTSSSNSFLSTNAKPNNSPPSSRSRHPSHAPPSPTPSIASTSFGGFNIVSNDGAEGEEEDRLEELREIGIKRQRYTNGIPVVGGNGRGAGAGTGAGMGMGMKRSLSVPVGGGFLSSGGNKTRTGREERQQKVKVEDGTNGGEVNSIEVRNKNTVKKHTMTRLQTLGITRDHPEFKELFSMVSRGVAFALRSMFKTRTLSREEKERMEELIEGHLRMYLPTEYQAQLMRIDIGTTKAPALAEGVSRISTKPVEGNPGAEMMTKENSSDTVVGEGDGDDQDVKMTQEEDLITGKEDCELNIRKTERVLEKEMVEEPVEETQVVDSLEVV